jgi:hypothetical protein
MAYTPVHPAGWGFQYIRENRTDHICKYPLQQRHTCGYTDDNNEVKVQEKQYQPYDKMHFSVHSNGTS